MTALSFSFPWQPEVEYGAIENRVEVHSDGTFVFDPEGTAMLTAAVDDEDECYIDAVCWARHDPYQWWLHTGVGQVLGWRWINHHKFAGESIVLYMTPHDLFEANGRGAVILDWRADPRHVFAQIPKVSCAGAALKQRLEMRIAELNAPDFEIAVC